MPAARQPAVRYRCSECSAESLKWLGRCAACQAWGTVEEFVARPVGRIGAAVGGGRVAGRSVVPAVPITEVQPGEAEAWQTGLSEFDRVLGGGLVPGGVVLLSGEPGVGKSTLLLAVAANAARSGRRVLLVTGEETAAQVQMRAARIGALADSLYLAAETDLGALMTHVEQVEPALLIVDSVQTVASPDVEGVPGGVSQVREVASVLVGLAKSRAMATLLIGHVTKDGSVAGPRTLEHLVDVVLAAEGERATSLRMVRAVKNRYGPTDEVGCFRLDGDGLTDLPDPSGLFLSRLRTESGPGGLGGQQAAPAQPGTCVTVTLEGRRPLVAEVQALVAPPAGPNPRRAVSGVDPARLSMTLAVLHTQQLTAALSRDVYVATVGGFRLTEPAADLAALLALYSAAESVPIPVDLVAVGEVGLSGEIRSVGGVDRRLAAAARLGFRRAIVPRGFGTAPEGVTVLEVSDVREAIGALSKVAGIVPRSQRPARAEASGPPRRFVIDLDSVTVRPESDEELA